MRPYVQMFKLDAWGIRFNQNLFAILTGVAYTKTILGASNTSPSDSIT
jgi:hypothetical protein